MCASATCVPLALIFATATAAGPPPVNPQGPAGLVVASVEKDSAAEKAGIKPGDELVSWVRAPNPPTNPSEARGTFASPFGLDEIETEQSPRGEMTLAGRRAGEPLSLALPAGDWKIEVRPALSGESLERYLRGKQRIAEGDVESGVALLREAASSLDRKDPESACWLLRVIGDTWSQAKKWDEAQAAYEEAKRRTRQPNVMAAIATAQGTAAREQPDLARAEAAFREALTHRESVEQESLAGAAALHEIGRLAWLRGNPASAGDWFGKALAIRETQAPGSLALAHTLFWLSSVSNATDREDAGDLCRRSLTIRERLVPVSLEVAQSLACMGGVALRGGDLGAARGWWERALNIQQQIAPESRPVALSLCYLGVVAVYRGDLAQADELFRRSLIIQERVEPVGQFAMMLADNLAAVSYSRGDLDAAEYFYRRSLEMSQRLGVGGLDTARVLDGLALVTRAAGELGRAEALHAQALALRERLAPETAHLAGSLITKADWAREREAWVEAEGAARHALALRERIAPGGLGVAEVQHLLGSVAQERGDLALAEGLYRQALTIRERLARGSTEEAATLHDLGQVVADQGQNERATEFFRRAVEALDTQGGRLGRPADTTPGFAAKQRAYYSDYARLLLDAGRPGEAFHTLERARARTLLTMLAERDLLLTDGLPPELEREQRRLGTEYDKAQSVLGGLTSAAKPEEVETALGRLRELRDQREAVAERIRRLSPRLASLRYPQPLDLEGVRAALDPGTVFLAYLVAKEKTLLFVVEPRGSRPAGGAGLTVLSLPVGEAVLREGVESYRRDVQQLDSTAGRTPSSEAARLYDLLLAPADAILRRHHRLLVSPDGPLHRLPFAALVRKGKHLVEWKPLHTVASGTLYAGLQESRPTDGARHWASQLAAFGDPGYPKLSREKGEEIQEPNVRDEVRRGRDLGPLPATRREVEAIAGLFPEGAAKYLGEDATEERAKTVGRGVRYLHFACHGLINQRFPLNSALALTIRERPQDGQDNGLLQAWEIMEKVRVDADLVTLSACDSGLGKEVGGEGVVGLTRAFQYAGARSVVASLWSVPDESTAELMRRFYGHLKTGRSKDEALRAAQIGAIRGRGRAAHPSRWAAFQLHGDWR